jgi:hypothetical protein
MTRAAIAFTIITSLCVIAWALLGLSRPAHAQGLPCGDRKALIMELHDKYRETPRAMGIEQRGGLVELLASDAGTWTLLATGPNGQACIVASGAAFEAMTQVLTPMGVPG